MNDAAEPAGRELTSGDLDAASDPFSLFAAWFAQAQASEPSDPNAMALATVDEDGMPDARIVLMKGFDAQGFVFYTNLDSRKGRQLRRNPRAALLFHWKSLKRQVRVRGPVEAVSDAEADAYFESRPRLSRIGAWASRQSEPLENRFALEAAVAACTARFGIGPVPRPPHWSGFRLRPVAMEFWREGAFRLHDRVAFRRDAGEWTRQRLYP